MGDHQRVTELDGDEVDALAGEALATEYFTRLESFLADKYDETVPTDDPRAFERADSVRAVTFEANPDAASQPELGVTVHFDADADTDEDEDADADTIVQATAERRGEDVDGDLELLFPAEIAPRPETAVRELFQPEGESINIEVTVTEADAVTSYVIETESESGSESGG